jgi:hypothetical protein
MNDNASMYRHKNATTFPRVSNLDASHAVPAENILDC